MTGSTAPESAPDNKITPTMALDNHSFRQKIREVAFPGLDAETRAERISALQSICSKIFKKDMAIAPEAMVSFCMQQADHLFAGRSDFNPKHDPTSLLRLLKLREDVPAQAKQEVFSASISPRLRYFENLAVQHRFCDPNAHGNDFAYLKHSLQLLGEHASLPSAQLVVSVLGKATFSRLAGTETDCRRTAAQALESICSSAKSTPAVFEYLIHCIPFIKSVSSAPIAPHEARSETAFYLDQAIGHLLPRA